MKRKTWILLFAAVIIGDIIGIQLKIELLQFIFKPLIIPVTIGYFDSQINNITKGIAKWVLFVFFFSCAGVVFLSF